MPTEVATGCPFLARCHQGRDELCAPARPALAPPNGESGPRVAACARGGAVALLSVRRLRKSYAGARDGVLRRSRVTVVDDVSLDVREGEVVSLVGSTGAGKSTLGMLSVRLLEADAGTITFDGVDISSADGRASKDVRARMQMLFQDPFEALSPRLTIGQVVAEPLDVQRVGERGDRMAIVRRAIADCRLPVDGADRVIVLDEGRIVEEGSGGTLLVGPCHPVTRMLLAASGRDLLFAGGTHPETPRQVDDFELAAVNRGGTS